jgi:hypothetical protein
MFLQTYFATQTGNLNLFDLSVLCVFCHSELIKVKLNEKIEGVEGGNE